MSYSVDAIIILILVLYGLIVRVIVHTRMAFLTFPAAAAAVNSFLSVFFVVNCKASSSPRLVESIWHELGLLIQRQPAAPSASISVYHRRVNPDSNMHVRISCVFHDCKLFLKCFMLI